MTSYAIITSIACVSYIYLGILILVVDSKTRIHQSFAILCATFALWSFGTTGQILFTGTSLHPWFDRINYTGAELFSIAGACFFLYLTKNVNKKRFQITLALAVLVIVMFQFLNWRWNLIAMNYPSGFWHILHNGIVNSINLLGLILVTSWTMRSRYHREKIQGIIIITSTITGTIMGLLVDYMLGIPNNASLSSAVPLLWLIPILIAILQYGLMRFTPTQISHEIVAAIDEAVFLIDNDREVSDLNETALNLSGRTNSDKRPISIEDIFIRPTGILQCLNTMSINGNRTCSRSEFLRARNSKPVLVRTDFHSIVDKWNDPILTLCICRPVKNIADFINKHGLSNREGDILYHIITGYTQPETAQALNLGLPTVKTHTTSLYNKLGISSRNGLFSLLRDEGVRISNSGDDATAL